MSNVLPMDTHTQQQSWLLVAMVLETFQLALHADFVIGNVQVPEKAYPYVNTVKLTLRGGGDLMTLGLVYSIMVNVHEFSWPELAFIGYNTCTHILYFIMYIMPVHKVRDFFYHSVGLAFAHFTKYPMPSSSTPGYSLNADGSVSLVKEWAFVPKMAFFFAYPDLLVHVYLVTLIAGYLDLFVLLPIAVLTAYLAGQRIMCFFESVRKMKHQA
eukprot:TRINITY_DN37861_c0_g1_i1.p1 TRINITY_DN37861_c0_g1~~TRINITY_DN37861_c0_g1_i1.p1  ORF type:complete len:233 (+),score=71.87 TRINITY_DN37861_c0_g1_i1:63-701(+)